MVPQKRQSGLVDHVLLTYKILCTKSTNFNYIKGGRLRELEVEFLRKNKIRYSNL